MYAWYIAVFVSLNLCEHILCILKNVLACYDVGEKYIIAFELIFTAAADKQVKDFIVVLKIYLNNSIFIQVKIIERCWN